MQMVLCPYVLKYLCNRRLILPTDTLSFANRHPILPTAALSLPTAALSSQPPPYPPNRRPILPTAALSYQPPAYLAARRAPRGRHADGLVPVRLEVFVHPRAFQHAGVLFRLPILRLGG